MNKKVINDKGFSLLELIIGLAISAVIIVAVFSFVLVGSDSYRGTSRVTTLQQEVSYVDNLVGEAIRDSNKDDVIITLYKDTLRSGYTGDVLLITTKKVFYYDKSETSLYLFNFMTPTTDYASMVNEENLISKYVTSFEAAFLVDSRITTPADVAAHHDNQPDKSVLTAHSQLVRVKSSYDYKSKTMNSNVTYKIRNK